jgi:hypothetical protein
METTHELKLAVVVNRIDSDKTTRQELPHKAPVVIGTPVVVKSAAEVDDAIEQFAKQHGTLPASKEKK